MLKDVTVPILHVGTTAAQPLKPPVSYPPCAVDEVQLFVRLLTMPFTKMQQHRRLSNPFPPTHLHNGTVS